MAIVHGTGETFESDVLKASELVLVDFWAEWCGPCRMLGPILEELATSVAAAEDLKGKVKIVKINVDEQFDLAEKYAIRSIPAVKLFKGGEIVDEFVGIMPKSDIEGLLRKHLV